MLSSSDFNIELSKKIRARAFNTFRATQNQPRFQFSGEFANVIQ